MSMFKAGRAVGKGVKYLTSLGSKIGKSLGSSVDKLGAGTRKAQAATIKGARGVRDAANSAGSAVREGAAAARRGYNTGRNYDLHLNDVMPKPSSGGMRKKTLSEFVNTDLKRMIRNPATMPGNKPSGRGPSFNDVVKSASPKLRAKYGYGDYMTKKPAGGKGVTREAYESFSKREPGIVKQANKMRGNRDIYGNSTGGMSKNRRAGIITGASIAAGYGVHRGNDALQNHYRSQKNAARGQ